MEVSVPVNELDITRIAVGQPARVRVAAIPDAVFVGKVARKSTVPLSESNNPFGQTREGVKEFEIFIGFDEQDERFRQSMTAEAQIEVARAEDVLAVPLEAVMTRESEEEGGEATIYVLVRDPAIGWREVPVKLGVRGLNMAEIAWSEGDLLREGMEVPLRDPRQIEG